MDKVPCGTPAMDWTVPNYGGACEPLPSEPADVSRDYFYTMHTIVDGCSEYKSMRLSNLLFVWMALKGSDEITYI
jgi:hypothetical protein